MMIDILVYLNFADEDGSDDGYMRLE